MKINTINTQRVLSKTQIDLADYAINCYRGCELGCFYCYSRQNKNIKKRKEAWGSFLDVKINAAEILQKELIYTEAGRVILGTTTESFQPQESVFGITRKVLETLKRKNIPVVILTKSPLIEEYIDLLTYHPANKIYFTFIFSDNTIKALFEPKSAGLLKRKAVIEKLMLKKIAVKIHIGPFIPYIEDLQRLFQLIPAGIQEVEIEVYNYRMGNAEEITAIIEKEISKKKADAITKVYSSEDTYSEFCQNLKAEASRINKGYNFTLNFIIPDFNCWYTDKIKYE